MDQDTEDQQAEIDRLNREIKRHWPDRWAKANAARNASKRRSQLRKWWKQAKAFDAFKEANPDAKCANCRNFAPYPMDIKGRMICEAESDFHGYRIAISEGLCLKWEHVQ